MLHEIAQLLLNVISLITFDYNLTLWRRFTLIRYTHKMPEHLILKPQNFYFDRLSSFSVQIFDVNHEC